MSDKLTKETLLGLVEALDKPRQKPVMIAPYSPELANLKREDVVWARKIDGGYVIGVTTVDDKPEGDTHAAPPTD